MRADPFPSPQMLEYFLRRTREHIALVSRNLEKVGKHPDYQQYAGLLQQRAAVHDASKFVEPERTPRIWAAEFTRCNTMGEPFEYPPGMQVQLAAAEQHHLRLNSHHPEYHPHPDSMSVLDTIEMVCDWTAMAQARNECQGSARCWAEKCLGHVYLFGEEKRALIFRIIAILET
jgi:hypothetical protein